MEIGDWITLAAVIVALGIGVASIQHTQILKKKDRKERIINIIVEWATEIHTISLKTDLPRIDQSLELSIEEKFAWNQQLIEEIKRSIVKKESDRIQFETLRKYGISLSRAQYIKSLAYRNFKLHRIKNNIDNVIDNLVATIFLRNIKVGMINPKVGFTQSGLVITDRVEDELKKSNDSIESLLDEYGKKLGLNINNIFDDASEIISKL